MYRRSGRIILTSFVCTCPWMDRGKLSFGVSLKMKPCTMNNR